MYHTGNVVVSGFASNGRSIAMVDTDGLQMEFSKISSETRTIDERLTNLERFIFYCQDQHPEVIRDYAVWQSTKDRIGVK